MNTCSECLPDASGPLAITMPSGSITAANSSVVKVLEKQQKQAETKKLHGEYRTYMYYIIRIYMYGVEIFLGKCPTTISPWITATAYISCMSASYISCNCLHAFTGSFFEKLEILQFPKIYF